MKWIRQMMFFSQEWPVLMYNFCRSYMFIFEWRSCWKEKWIISIQKIFFPPSVIFGQAPHTPSPPTTPLPSPSILSGVGKFFCLAGKLKKISETFFFFEEGGWELVLWGDLTYLVIWRNWIILGEATVMENQYILKGQLSKTEK